MNLASWQLQRAHSYIQYEYRQYIIPRKCAGSKFNNMKINIYVYGNVSYVSTDITLVEQERRTIQKHVMMITSQSRVCEKLCP